MLTDLQYSGQIRLVGDYPWRGRVEFLNVPSTREWGTVCTQGWTSDDAYVACRELGYHTLSGTYCSGYSTTIN